MTSNIMSKNGGLIYILIATTLYFISLSFITTVLARFSRDLGISIERTSILWSLLFLTALTLRPLAGYVADRVGFMNALTIGSASLLIAAVTYSYATNYTSLIIGRVIQGVSSAFFISPSIAATAMLAGFQASTVLGIRSALISFSNVISPPIAGFLADNLGYSTVFAMSALISLVLTMMLSITHKLGRVKDAQKEVSRNIKWSHVLNRDVVLVALSGMMLGASFMSLTGILQMHYRDLGVSASTYGLVAMIIALSGLVTRLTSGKLASKYRPELISITGFTLLAVGTSLFIKYYVTPQVYLSATIYGLGIGLIIPSNQYRVAISAPKGGKNRAIALLNMGFDLGAFMGPTLYGYLASRAGYVVAYEYLLIPPLIAITLLYYLKRVSNIKINI